MEDPKKKKRQYHTLDYVVGTGLVVIAIGAIVLLSQPGKPERERTTYQPKTNPTRVVIKDSCHVTLNEAILLFLKGADNGDTVIILAEKCGVGSKAKWGVRSKDQAVLRQLLE